MHSRLQKSIEDMAEFCPNLAFTPAGAGGFWRGVVQPIQSLEYLEGLLDDIHHNRPVYAVPGGGLRHLPTCQADHCHHEWMDGVQELRVPFEIAVHHNGNRAHPKCWVLSPIIPPTKRRHIWPDGSICPFLASEDVWVWNRDTVADFMPHVLIWLVSWLVFDQTGEWIVGEHEGTPEFHLAVLRASDQCWCRSGRKYFKCHLREDEMAAAIQRVRG